MDQGEIKFRKYSKLYNLTRKYCALQLWINYLKLCGEDKGWTVLKIQI